jgi:hypothetical protein
MTGFQRKGKAHADLVNEIDQTLTKGCNRICYIQKSLTGANEVYKRSSHVTLKHSERDFNTVFDGKRLIGDCVINSTTFYDTKPFRLASQAFIYRGITSKYNHAIYNKFSNTQLLPSIKTTFDLCQRALIRAIAENKAGLCWSKTGVGDFIKILWEAKNFSCWKNIKYKNFKNFEIKSLYLIAGCYLKGKFVNKSIPVNKVSIDFCKIVKRFLPSFDLSQFLEFVPDCF